MLITVFSREVELQEFSAENLSSSSSPDIPRSDIRKSFDENDFVEPFGPRKLKALLNKTLTGETILKRGAVGSLSFQSQQELVNIVAEYHIAVGGKTTEDTLRNYADAVALLLKHEKKVNGDIPFKPP